MSIFLLRTYLVLSFLLFFIAFICITSSKIEKDWERNSSTIWSGCLEWLHSHWLLNLPECIVRAFHVPGRAPSSVTLMRSRVVELVSDYCSCSCCSFSRCFLPLVVLFKDMLRVYALACPCFILWKTSKYNAILQRGDGDAEYLSCPTLKRSQ